MATRPFDDDYRELIEGARDAVRELLEGSTVDSWLQLRASYTSLCTTLNQDDDRRGRAERHEQTHERYAEERKARDAWRQLPRAARESLVLQALGDDRLIIPELVERMNAELGYGGRDRFGHDHSGKVPVAVYQGDVSRVVRPMHRAGQLDRVEEPAPGCKIRHRYFRKQALDGPIADLERAYRDDQEGGGA